MRTPVILLLAALAGLLGGGALISMAALGGCLIFAAVAAALFGLALFDFPDRQVPAARKVRDIEDFLREKAVEPW